MKFNAGLAVLLAVIVVSVSTYVVTHRGGQGQPTVALNPGSEEAVVVTGPVGSEKLEFLADPEVQRILHDRFNITVKPEKAGSLEMVQDESALNGKDFAWPSSQVALELFKSKGMSSRKSEVIFNSPIVLYTWDKVLDALKRTKTVTATGEVNYVTDFPGLVRMVQQGKKWSDLGLSELYGSVSIHTTDPTTSNSGMMFCGLLASMYNGGNVVTEANLPKVSGQMEAFFGQLGLMERSSADLFSQFVTQGMGSNPIVVGYENQLTEFVLQHPEHADVIRRQISILYPRPTVWSNHPLIALTANGTRFLEALKDPDIQRIAWERHGFRSGMPGIQNDPKILKVAGIPDRIENVVPMPKPAVMQQLLAAAGKG